LFPRPRHKGRPGHNSTKSWQKRSQTLALPRVAAAGFVGSATGTNKRLFFLCCEGCGKSSVEGPWTMDTKNKDFEASYGELLVSIDEF
jgi:hypothetical protein